MPSDTTSLLVTCPPQQPWIAGVVGCVAPGAGLSMGSSVWLLNCLSVACGCRPSVCEASGASLCCAVCYCQGLLQGLEGRGSSAGPGPIHPSACGVRFLLQQQFQLRMLVLCMCCSRLSPPVVPAATPAAQQAALSPRSCGRQQCILSSPWHSI